MATLGLTKLEAVNLVLSSISELPAPALDSSGSWPSLTFGPSIAARAEEMLERVSRNVQMRGFRGNTVRCKKYTVAGAPGNITFGTNVLKATPAGPTQFRNICIREDKAYDLEADSATFAVGDYWFDIITYHDFSTLEPDLKELIVKETSVEMQRRWRGSPEQDTYLAQERDKAEVVADRPKRAENQRPVNPEPMVTGPALGGVAGGRGQ